MFKYLTSIVLFASLLISTVYNDPLHDHIISKWIQILILSILLIILAILIKILYVELLYLESCYNSDYNHNNMNLDIENLHTRRHQ